MKLSWQNSDMSGILNLVGFPPSTGKMREVFHLGNFILFPLGKRIFVE